MTDRRLINGNQLFQGRMGIGKRLEIDNEFLGPVSFLEVIHPRQDLFADRLQTAGGFRTKGIVVAVGTSVYPDGPVPVRAAESPVNADLVNPAAELFLQETAVGIVAFPGKWRLRRHVSRLKIED